MSNWNVIKVDLGYYCPCCGETSKGESLLIAPGKTEWQCPKCKEKFIISVEFLMTEDAHFSMGDK